MDQNKIDINKCKDPSPATSIIQDQPQLHLPPYLELGEQRPQTSRSYRPSQWFAEGRNIASRGSSKPSILNRRKTPHRPCIGKPSDFRRVAHSIDRTGGFRSTGGFRPLELSIYIPGNELPSLPVFDAASKDKAVDLAIPRPVLVRSRSDNVLSQTHSRTSTSFTIPRKPIPSNGQPSFDESQSSFHDYRPSTGTSIQSRSQSIYRTPGMAHTTQDFLNSLDSHLPIPPMPKLNRSATEPILTIHRRASDQNLRLRNHIEERQDMERRLKDFDAILEERQGNSPGVSPILPIRHDPFTITEELDGDEGIHMREVRNTQFSPLTSHPTLVHKRSAAALVLAPPTPSTISPTTPIFSTAQFIYPVKPKPIFHRTTSARKRVSQWLTRSSLAKPREDDIPECHSELALTHDRTAWLSMSTVSTASEPNVHEPSAWDSPRLHRPGSSLSSWQTQTTGRSFQEGRMSFDIEKMLVTVPVMLDVDEREGMGY
ncbi:hypothetical protein MMC06_002144 [Schaereria dolodes]|nr:hypothetical protein [Schaereria dolodes]